MKPPPAKSALDGDLTVTKTAEVANEILNEIQRSRGGDTVTEDESRYRVIVGRPNVEGARDWTGDVIGPPSVYPLDSVCVVAAGNTLVVLDKLNRELWRSTLSFRLAERFSAWEGGSSSFGAGPCVERGRSLYVFDQAVLTAFDLATGNVRWRLPSVGVQGLFFDAKGMMYVNTTTAKPENIKYSRQIDVDQKIRPVILKLDPQTGRIHWTAQPGGLVAYVSGPYVYTLESYRDPNEGVENPYAIGIEIPSHVLINRLDPDDGQVLWQHYQKRAPLDVQFDGNTIQIVFRKEVQVLRFYSF